MSRICTTSCIALLLTSIMFLLVGWHKYALDDADRQATIRMLSMFHKEYLHSSGLDKQKYLKQLKKFNEKHARMLDEYIRRIESKDDNRNENE